MNTKTQLNRRNFLRGTGVALALPWMESLNVFGSPKAGAPPKRFLAVYVGHGFAITLADDHPAREWSWYPRVVDGKMKFGKSMAGFNEFSDQTTVVYGLEHPRVIRSNGHGTADSFLTGSNIGDAIKYPSIDQVAAGVHGKKTRYPSLVLGNEGGLGTRGTARTLSYNQFGRPIPSSNDLLRLYDNMFNSDPKLQLGAKRRLADAQRPAARNDRHLVQRVVLRHLQADKRVAGFVVRG